MAADDEYARMPVDGILQDLTTADMRLSNVKRRSMVTPIERISLLTGKVEPPR